MGGAAAEKRESGEEGGASASEDLDPASPDKDAGKKKKNKCQMCKKKVGLTGWYSRGGDPHIYWFVSKNHKLCHEALL